MSYCQRCADLERENAALRETDGLRASWLRWIGKTYPGRRFANDLYLLTQGAMGTPLPSPYTDEGALEWNAAVALAKTEFDSGLERIGQARVAPE